MTMIEKQAKEEVKLPKPSIWGMIWSPGEQFQRIRERPIILGALLINAIIFTIAVLLRLFGSELNFSDVSADEAMFITGFTAVFTLVIGIISPLIGCLLSSLIYFIISKFTSSNVSFKQLFSMNMYIMFISAIGMVINGIGALLAGGGDPETIYTSLGPIFQAKGALGAVLKSIEVFSIWHVILTATGLNRVANFSKGLAWGISIAFFIIGIIFAVIGASLAEMVGV